MIEPTTAKSIPTTSANETEYGPIHVWSASRRVSLTAGPLRFLALAKLVLERANFGMYLVDDPRTPDGLTAKMLSWLSEHDRFLAVVRAELDQQEDVAPPQSIWSSVILTDDLALVGAEPLASTAAVPNRVLWLVSTQDAVCGRARPSVALTLTRLEAETLRSIGIDAANLVNLSPTSRVGDRPMAGPARFVVALDWAQEGSLPMALHWLATAATSSALPPLVEVLPDAQVRTAGRLFAPVHPWAASRTLERADAVFGLGHSPAVDLLLAEAGSLGKPVLRLVRSTDSTWLPDVLSQLPACPPDDPVLRKLGLAGTPADLSVRLVDLPDNSPDITDVGEIRDLLFKASRSTTRDR